MGDLTDLLHRASDDVPDPDPGLAAAAWAEGSRRRRRGQALTAAGAAALVATSVGVGLMIGNGTPASDPGVVAAPGTTQTSGRGALRNQMMDTNRPDEGLPSTPAGTTQGEAVTAPDPTAARGATGAPPTSDPRLVSPPPAPDRRTWVILVLERTAGDAPQDLTGLPGTTWQQVPNGTYPWRGSFRTIELGEDRLVTRGGCNDASGAFTVGPDTLAAPRLPATTKYCEDEDLLRSDNLVAALLAGPARAVLGDDGRLYLAGFVSVDDVPPGWTSDHRVGPNVGTGPATPPPWATKGTGPHTEPGPRDLAR